METKQLSGYTDVHSMGKAGPGAVCSVLRLSPFRQALGFQTYKTAVKRQVAKPVCDL